MLNKKLNIYDLPMAKNMVEYNFETQKERVGKIVVSRKVVELSAKVAVDNLIDKFKHIK